MIGETPQEAAKALKSGNCISYFKHAASEEAERQISEQEKEERKREQAKLAEGIAKLKRRREKKEELARGKDIKSQIGGMISDLEAHAARIKEQVAALKVNPAYRTDEQLEDLEEEVGAMDELAAIIGSLDIN